jgi:RNA polymerase sigma-70 factor (ECF subfamily)
VREYRPYFFAVAKKCLEDRPADEWSSVVQDSLVRSFERIDQFRGHTRKELMAWLVQIVANRARDRRQSRNHLSISGGLRVEELLPISESTPSAQAARREESARLLAAVEKLPPHYREVIELRAFQNLGYDEIAARMNSSNDAVRYLWVRALRKLRAELGDDHELA